MLLLAGGLAAGPAAPAAAGAGNTQQIGLLLYSRYLFPFELTSIILLVAMIGAVMIARGRRDAAPPRRAAPPAPRPRPAGRGNPGGRMIPLAWPLGLSALLFCIGVVGVLVRRNVIVIFMSIELMLNAANLAFVAFARQLGSLDGQVFVFFVMTVAAAEVAVGLAIIVNLFRNRETVNVDEINLLKG